MTARSFILLLCGAIAPNAIAQVTIDTSAQYKIRNYNSGLVLGIEGASQTAGTNAVQWTDNGSQEQYWHFVPEGNRQYLIENMNSHQVLGIANASTTPGALALQWADNGTPDHRWQAMDAGGGLYRLRNVHSGLVLGIRDASTDPAALALQWNDNGTSDHLWSFEPGGQAYADPAAVSVSYDMGDRAWIHDPSMTNAAGTYHLYSTHGGIHVHSSSDRINFTDDGQVLPFVPSWAYNYTPGGDLWAPDISYRSGQYWLYYAASRFGSSHSAIGLATSATAEPWSFADSGDAVLTSAQCPGSNAIDPGITLDDSGTPWMVFGSWSGGIYIVQIDSDTGQVASGASCIHLASRTSGRAIEGAYIYPHNGYYYLFVSRCVLPRHQQHLPHRRGTRDHDYRTLRRSRRQTDGQWRRDYFVIGARQQCGAGRAEHCGGFRWRSACRSLLRRQ